MIDPNTIELLQNINQNIVNLKEVIILGFCVVIFLMFLTGK